MKSDLYSLQNVFQTVVVKKLTKVEVDISKSNQHEFNGTKSLEKIFGNDVRGTSKRKQHEVTFIYLADSHHEPSEEQVEVTWYDARFKSYATTGRSELRLYYKPNEVMRQAEEDDLLLIAKNHREELFFIVIDADAKVAEVVKTLFDQDQSLARFIEVNDHLLPSVEQLVKLFIPLAEVGVANIMLENVLLEKMKKEFGFGELIDFPRTKDLNKFARAVYPVEEDDPDVLIVGYMEQEEKIFRILEKQVFKQYEKSALDDIDNFIAASLTFINRRKSRVGISFELHLASIFKDNFLTFNTNAYTEGKQKPDFIFPSIDCYHDGKFDSQKLTMLAAKYSCKERWRQILKEAKRIKTKHLITFEQGISSDQTRAC